MMKFKRLETIAMIVGAVIGAGFATGSEINLYFRGKSLLSPIISALFFGGLCALFLLVGRTEQSPFLATITKVVSSTGSLIVFCAMSACFSTLFKSVFFGVALSVLCAALSGKARAFGMMNLIMVFVIFLLTGWFGLTSEATCGQGLGIYQALSYATLNFVTAGELIRRRGRSAGKADVLIVSIGTSLVMAFITLMMFFTVGNSNSSVPLLDVAAGRGVSGLATAVIFCAVFTTQLATSEVLLKGPILIGLRPLFSLAFLTALALFGASVGFTSVVGVGYPVGSVLGLVYVCIAVFEAIKNGVRKARHLC